MELAQRVVARYLSAVAGKNAPIIIKYFAGIYEKHKAGLDAVARDSLDQYTLVDLLEHHPNASDEELLQLASRHLHMFSETVDGKFAEFIGSTKTMSNMYLGTDLGEPYLAEADVRGNDVDIHIELQFEGEWFEIPDDPMDRVEVPRMTHETHIDGALKALGAYSAMTQWKMESPKDRTYESGYDAVIYYTRAAWKVDWQALNAHFGMPAFTEKFHKLLPGARAEHAEDEKRRGESTSLPKPKKPRRR